MNWNPFRSRRSDRESHPAASRPTALSWFYHFLRGPNPLKPSLWRGRLSPLTFRRFQPTDAPQCRKLYDLNEPGRFPPGGAPGYEAALLAPTTYFLVAEQDGRIVATGGMSYRERPDVAVFCFGLVHPDRQGTGVGTALLLARLALLNTEQPLQHVFIFAVPKSIGYYQRFGFIPYEPWQDESGTFMPTGLLRISPAEIRGCRRLLEQHQIVVPPDQHLIPVMPEPVGEGKGSDGARPQ